jgi:outer membrane receptor protein involved in Fe transport
MSIMITAKTSLHRAALKGSVATFAVVMFASSGVAHAQAAATAAADAAAEDDTIVVTGSLIKNPNLVSASPINVTTAESIALKGVNTAEQVLRDIPGIVPGIGSAVNNGNGGASFVDLRGLGSRRNIVLLDGNRITPANFEGQVDLNNVPLALVERVDALTGAAVTTYGADAITGVVNFVTKQDFSGVDLQLSNTLTERGDGNYFRADVTVGGNFDDGRGNAVLSVGYQKADPIYQGARDFSVVGRTTATGAAGGSSTGVPSRFSGTRGLNADGSINTAAAFAPTGAMGANPDFNPNRPISSTNQPMLPVLAPVAAGQANGGVRQINPATGFTTATPNSFNFNPYNIFQTPFERFNIYAQAKYALSDSVEAYTRGMFSKNKVGTIIAPSGSFGSVVAVPLANPYLPAGMRNQFCAFNVAPVVNGVNAAGVATSGQAAYVPRFAPDQCARAAQGLSANENVLNADGTISSVSRATPSVSVTTQRRTTELGPRTSDYTTQVFDYRAGLRGSITDSIDWDVNASYGESSNQSVIGGYVQTSKLQQAANATNTTTCVNNTNGCVPLDLFGPEGSITPAMATFIETKAFTEIRTSLAQLRGVVSGDLGFAVPGATDAIGFAVGAEYRKYAAEQLADAVASSAGQLGGGGAATLQFTGGYDVKEVYGELIAPLVQDKPFFQNLTVEAGARYSSYSVEANPNRSFDAFTWKAGGTWEMVDGFKVRGNYSRAVRAPNLAELFQPPVVTLVNLGTDPCAGTAPNANSLLRAVCIAQGAPAGSIGSITNPTAGQAQSTQSGNLGLVPEKADTWTVGAVFQPSFAPGLAITADYYDIRVNDAITTPVSGDVIAACFGSLSAASATDPACTTTRRNPVTGTLDGAADTTPGLFMPLTNAGRIATRGLDLTATYSNDIGFATLGLQGNANWTFSQTFQASPTSINRQCVGYYSPDCGFTGSLQPKFQSSLRATLGFDTFDISGVWRHLSGMIQEPLNAAEDGPFFEPYRSIPSYDYFDLTGRFSINQQITLIATVTNLLDKQPPIVGSEAGSTSFNSGNTFPSTYDALGRRYTMQVQVKF